MASHDGTAPSRRDAPVAAARSAGSLAELGGRIGPAALWAAAIFWFSAQPDLPRVDQTLLDLLLKKGAHALGYAVFAVLLHRALGPGFPGGPRARRLIAWALAVLYAVSDEWHQSFVPGRTASAVDVVVDGGGALAGLLVRARLARTGRPPASDPTAGEPAAG